MERPLTWPASSGSTELFISNELLENTQLIINFINVFEDNNSTHNATGLKYNNSTYK